MHNFGWANWRVMCLAVCTVYESKRVCFLVAIDRRQRVESTLPFPLIPHFCTLHTVLHSTHYCTCTSTNCIILSGSIIFHDHWACIGMPDTFTHSLKLSTIQFYWARCSWPGGTHSTQTVQSSLSGRCTNFTLWFCAVLYSNAVLDTLSTKLLVSLS